MSIFIQYSIQTKLTIGNTPPPQNSEVVAPDMILNKLSQ